MIYNCLNPSEYAQGPGGRRLFVMGEFGAHKGQDRLIKYCVQAGLELDIAGPVARIMELDDIEAEAAKGARSDYADVPDFKLYCSVRHLIDGQRIKFHGSVGGELKRHLLGNALALVMPNRWSEPFGMVAIEAMASGTPVVAMQTGALPELIRHGVTGYLAPTFDELCGYLDSKRIALLDRSLSRPHVLRKFSAEAIAKQYMDLYRQLSQRKKYVTTPRRQTQLSRLIEPVFSESLKSNLPESTNM
jgi:glycosyltransferase involved in cell wall biosynthesis